MKIQTSPFRFVASSFPPSTAARLRHSQPRINRVPAYSNPATDFTNDCRRRFGMPTSLVPCIDRDQLCRPVREWFYRRAFFMPLLGTIGAFSAAFVTSPIHEAIAAPFFMLGTVLIFVTAILTTRNTRSGLQSRFHRQWLNKFERMLGHLDRQSTQLSDTGAPEHLRDSTLMVRDIFGAMGWERKVFTTYFLPRDFKALADLYETLFFQIVVNDLHQSLERRFKAVGMPKEHSLYEAIRAAQNDLANVQTPEAMTETWQIFSIWKTMLLLLPAIAPRYAVSLSPRMPASAAPTHQRRGWLDYFQRELGRMQVLLEDAVV